MADYQIVSADAHVIEPPKVWETWLPRKYQDKAPKLVRDWEGGHAWLFAGSAEPDPIGLTATAGKSYDQFRWTGVTYDDIRPGCYDGKARLADMEEDGVDAEVIFAPQRTIGQFLGDDDESYVLAGVNAYNSFLKEEFCAGDPTRLIGVGQIPSLGVDVATEFLGKLVTDGFKAVAISNWPAGGDALGGDDDYFWAAAAEAGVPVCIHINLVSRRARMANRRAGLSATGNALYGKQTGAGSTSADTSADADADAAAAAVAEKARARAISGLGGVFSVVPATIGQLIFTGVFERFPGLHVSLIETGVGWIPHFIEQLDDKYWRNRSWGRLPISRPPSEYWHDNMSATFIIDRAGIELRHAVGVDNIMWSTDYPHHGNDWPYSRKVIEDTMGHIPSEERQRIVAQNAVSIFGLDDGA